MRVRRKTALGIDLGERCISVALVEKGEQGLRTLAAATADLPAGEPEQPESAPGKVLARLLTQLGRRARLHRTNAAVAVSADPLVMQLLDLPKHMPTNVGEFVRSELQQYVALSGRNIVSDFCGIGSGVQKRLLATAADGGRIQEMVKVCSATGVAVDVVEPSMLAYARAFLEQQKGTRYNGDVMVAMLGARTLTVCLFRRGTLDFIRTRSLPAEAGTPRLLCPWLAEELKAVARYYDAQISPTSRDWPIAVIVHDGMHRTDEIAPLLAAEAPAGSFTVVDVYEALTSPGPAKEGPPRERASMIAVGAALRLLGTGDDGLKINLLPKTVTEARSLSRHLLLTANVCALVLIGVFAASQLLVRTTGALDRRIEHTRLSGELYTTPALIAEEKFLDQETAHIRQRLSPLRKAMNGRHEVDWPDILRAVREAASADVSVTQVQCSDGRTLSLKGLASSCPAAEAFVRNLEGHRPFASASLTLVQRQQNEDGRLEYRVDCSLNAKGGQSS